MKTDLRWTRRRILAALLAGPIGLQAQSLHAASAGVQDDGRLRGRFTERRVIPMTCTVAADGRVQRCIPGEMAEDDVLELARIART